MSQKVLERLSAQFGARILESSSFRGDEEAVVAPADWRAVATFLRDDPECAMDHFIDLTVVDYPERESDDVQPLPRFDVVLFVRSLGTKHRIRLKTRVADGEELDTLINVWLGADWTEREAWDMFGVRFRGHPDLRRILMYEEFVGYPLRKDYPIQQTQPLIPYRDVPSAKMEPLGETEGSPFGRIDWAERLGRTGEEQVSPAIALQLGERTALSAPTPPLAPSREKAKD